MSANAIGDEAGDEPDLRAERKAAGVSQQRLADLARCSVAMVRLLESGYRPYGGSAVLQRIALVLAASNVSEAAVAGGSAATRGDGARHAGS